MPTLATVRSRVQIRINDTDAKRGTLDTVLIDHAIADAALVLGGQIEAPHLYIASAFTITGGGDTFTLPTPANSGYASLTQYAGDVRIRLRARGYFLQKRTVEELDALRDFLVPGPPPLLGVPSDFCLWEEMDNDLQGRCWPGAGTSEVCDLFVGLVPDDLRDATDMDAANVRFSRYGVTALVLHTAAILVAAMSAEDLQKRRLNPAVAPLWEREAKTALYTEAMRRNNSESSGRTQRWVS